MTGLHPVSIRVVRLIRGSARIALDIVWLHARASRSIPDLTGASRSYEELAGPKICKNCLPLPANFRSRPIWADQRCRPTILYGLLRVCTAYYGLLRPKNAKTVITLLLLAAVLPLHGAAIPAATAPVLTNIQQILDLGRGDVRRPAPMVPTQLRGVVTFSFEGTRSIFVQDATGGIQVNYTNSDARVVAGQLVEVSGLGGPALVTPIVTDGQVRVLGKAPMPEPRRVPTSRLAVGEAYGQWVAIEGVVRDVAWNGRRFLFISSDGLRFHAVMQPCAVTTLPTNWIDARVELRGVCLTDTDRENKPMGFTLYSPGTNEITFVRRPGEDASPYLDIFSQPATSTDRIRQQSDDRVKVAGTVLFQVPGGTIYLRTDTGGVEARPLVPLARAGPKSRHMERAPLPSLRPGMRIDLVGAPTDAAFAPVLQDAEVRVVDSGSAGTPRPTLQTPRPTAVDDTALLSGKHDRDLISVKARLLNQSMRESAGMKYEALTLQSGEAIFEATLPSTTSNSLPALLPDSYIEAVGLCLMERGGVKNSFRLLLRDPAELRVVGRWSVWRSPEAAKVGGIAAALGLAALLWIWTLRRRVAKGTADLALANRSLRSEVEERKRAEAELAGMLDTEKELNQLKSRFVSIISHEFRTPLGIIMSAADILRKYTDRLAPERRTEHLQEIHDATRHMAGMMEQVLLLGRAESGRLAFTAAPLDLAGLCQKLVDEQNSAGRGRCPIRLLTSSATPKALGDEGLLRHIFSNLLSNAVKYSSEGSSVEFAVERSGEEALFAVRDRGIGIPETEAARLFTAFHRCTNVGEIPGTGLGLLIVKRCVELHGGTITFESSEGAGTTFTVRLPLFRETERQSKSPPRASS